MSLHFHKLPFLHMLLLGLLVAGGALLSVRFVYGSHSGCGPNACNVRNNIWASRTSGNAPLNITIGGDAWGNNTNGFSMRLHCQTGPTTRRCRNSTSCSTGCSYNPSSTTTYHIRHNAYVEGHDGDDAYKDSSGMNITVYANPPPPPRIPTWSVTLSATPASGLAPLSTTLSSTGSGAAIGGIRWRFDCTDDGVWDTDVTNTNTTQTAPCSYPAPGTYTARVRSVREGLSRDRTVAVSVSGPPTGAVDAAAAGTCSTGLTGWARDDDDTSVSLQYEVYRDGFRGICPGCLAGSGIANEPGNGPGNHRFTSPLPAGPPSFDGNPHTYYLYAKDASLAVWQLINPAGTDVTCFEIPVINLTAMPSTPPLLPNGDTARVQWTVTNDGGVTCDATNGTPLWQGTDVGTTGNVVSDPLLGDTTFTITCMNPTGMTTENVTVLVEPPPDPVISGDQFCGPFGSLTWSYGGMVEDYQLQVDDNSGFTSPEFNPGWVNAPGAMAGTLNVSLTPGDTYYARVKTRNAAMVESGWSATYSFDHPPRISFTIDPENPAEALPFTVTDTSDYDGNTPDFVAFDMGDGMTYSFPPLPPPYEAQHTYTDSGAKTITLTIDAFGRQCVDSQAVNVNERIPTQKEVLPQ